MAKIDKTCTLYVTHGDHHFKTSLAPSTTVSNWPLIPGDSTLKALSDLLSFFYPHLLLL